MQRSLVSHFPEEVWNNIESYLSTSDLIRLGITSKTNFQSMYIDMARRIFADFSIIQIEAIENKVVYFLASDGRIWHSVLEENDSKKAPSFPAPFIDLPPIKKMFNLWRHGPAVIIILIDDNNDVWLCSDVPLLNWAARDGKWSNWLNGLKSSLTKPIKIKDLKNIKEISARGDFIYLLDMNGCVSRKDFTDNPVKFIENIDHMTDGNGGLFFIDKQGKVYKSEDSYCSIIEGPSQIISIIKGHKQHYFLDRDGKVWNQCPQDGTVRQFNNLPPVKQIIISDSPAYSHEFVAYFIDHNDAVWVYGINEKGLLGLGETNEVTEPTLLENLPPIKQIMSNGYQAFLLDTSKKMWLLGALDDRQQPKKICSIPTLLESLPNIDYMAIDGHKNPNFMDEQGALWIIGCNGTLECDSLDKINT